MSYTLFLFLAYTIILLSLRYYYKHNRYQNMTDNAQMFNDERLTPHRAVHPGEILREELRERGISTDDFARRHLAEGASIVNISSSRDRMSQPQTESYTAAKGGIAALTHALAVTLRGKARVNSISPGWIDTDYKEYDGPDAIQQPAGRVGNPMDIANMVLFLCSDKAGFITGENICIDGGMTRQMIYHGDHGWTLKL